MIIAIFLVPSANRNVAIDAERYKNEKEKNLTLFFNKHSSSSPASVNRSRSFIKNHNDIRIKSTHKEEDLAET